jgi:hypothetical protein
MDPLSPQYGARHGESDTSPEPDTYRWSVADLVDFDYYVDEDERLSRASAAERKRLTERDRRIYREQIEQTVTSAAEHSPRHRSQALRRWLAARRRGEDPSLRPLLPGAVYARGQRLVSIALTLLGFVIGIGVASALLHYDGQHPVNVSWYVFVLVLVQMLLVAATLAAWYARRTGTVRAAVQDFSLLGQLIKPLFSRAAHWVQRQRLAHVPPDVRERAQAKQGLLEAHYALYGQAAYLPMLIPAQLFGIGFNLGVIAITVALEWFTDLAFGWGSALNVEPATIHTIAHVIALPWSWLFGEGVGVPTLEQVAGTRIALKDPLFLLDAEHLRSWRWFLVLAVFTYGLLPRLALLGLSILKQRRTLAALPFTHQRTQALYARMVTPSLETGGGSGEGPQMPIPAPLKPLTAPRAAPREEPPQPAPAASAPEPKAESSAEPEPEPKPKPVPEPKSEREPKPEPEPKSEAVSTPEPRPTSEPKPAARLESKPKPEPKPMPKPAPKPESKPAPKPAPKPEPKPAPKPEPKLEPTPVQRPARAAPAGKISGVDVAADACVLLIHVDIADMLEESDHGRLQQLLRQLSGWRVAASATFGGGSGMAAQALGLIQDARWQSPPARVALLQDGSQPPITESLRFLRSVRAAAGEQAQLLLALVGDPEGEDPLPSLSAFDFADWQRKIEQLGDPYLRLEMLAGPEVESD